MTSTRRLHYYFNRGFLMPCLAAAVLTAGIDSRAAETPAITLRGSQILGPAQQDLGEADWLARLNNWKRDTQGQTTPWLTAMQSWRNTELARIGYDDAQYRRAELRWTQRDFVQTQAMMEDRYLYDPVTGRYTVKRFLDDLRQRYGGIDSVLLWPVYPNLGIDDRNQWDMPGDLPGGLDGVRALIQQFHAHGVKVLFPTMPWDTGTREVGSSMPLATASLMARIGADGINGDTMDGLPLAYREAADASGQVLTLEPELSFKDDAMLAYNQQSWGYWANTLVPMVSKWKWLEPRHMVHVCDRWATDRTSLLQDAFFNGTGIQSWENVWGWWNQITPRDGAALRRIATIYRAFPEHMVSAGWQPHVPTLHYGVYASAFPRTDSTLWTIINRTDWAISASILRLPHRPGQRYFDLWQGRELQSRIAGDEAELSVPLEAHGYGAILRLEPGATLATLAATLQTLAQQARKPLSAYVATWQPLAQKMVAIAPTAAARTAPPGMLKIPAGQFDFKVHGIEIEGENKPGLDVQYPWEAVARRHHVHRLAIRSFYMDRYPVTNAEYQAFMRASGYRPADPHNFLRHWVDGAPKPEDAQRPVVWVSLEDARAYLRWSGKRLPHEWEWQYAAQGLDQRLYPWGNDWDAAMVQAPELGRRLSAPDVVGQRPQAASPFGVEDLVGSVWQWTSEFADEHTRAAVLRGGSYYQPQNSYWYFPQAYRLDEHGKYLLMAPSKDRSGTIGFRGVRDGLPD